MHQRRPAIPSRKYASIRAPCAAGTTATSSPRVLTRTTSSLCVTISTVDFSFDETQKDVQTLASAIFERATPERIKQIESTDDHVDRDLWAELARADLLGIALPEQVGGSGHGVMELCVLLQEMGRR